MPDGSHLDSTLIKLYVEDNSSSGIINGTIDRTDIDSSTYIVRVSDGSTCASIDPCWDTDERDRLENELKKLPELEYKDI